MGKKKKREEPAEIPVPTYPNIVPGNLPEEPVLPDKEPEIVPEEEPVEPPPSPEIEEPKKE